MKTCWHKWGRYGKPYKADVLTLNMREMTMVQTRYCEKCGALSFRKTVLPKPAPDCLQVAI